MLFRLITLIFIAVFVYRLLSRFILPGLRMSSATGDRLRQMQERMNEMERKVNEKKGAKAAKEGDYIDYEEVKPNRPR